MYQLKKRVQGLGDSARIGLLAIHSIQSITGTAPEVPDVIPSTAEPT